MFDTGRYVDLDPPPPGSARLYHDMDAVPDSKPTAEFRPSKPTPAQIDRLRRDLAIYQSVEGGMSQRMAAKVFGLSQPGILKAYRRISCRQSRV